MAFEFDYLKQKLQDIKAVGGFDKPLQLAIVNDRVRIYYLESAVIYDEKIDKAEAYQNQRRRWYSSQYKYFYKNFITGFLSLFQKKWDYFNLGFLNNIFPSRLISLFLLFAVAGAYLLFGRFFLLSPFFYVGLLILYALVLLGSVESRLWKSKLPAALVKLPGIIWLTLLVHLKLKGADKQFIHTVHYKSDVDKTANAVHH